jgi:hypothetical protein
LAQRKPHFCAALPVGRGRPHHLLWKITAGACDVNFTTTKCLDEGTGNKFLPVILADGRATGRRPLLTRVADPEELPKFAG